MLWRLTPKVDRLWSMAEVAGGGQIVEHGGGGWRQNACHTKADEHSVKADDEAVIVLDAVHQGHGQLA